MSKYIYTVAKMLNFISEQHRVYDTNTIISDLFDDNINEFDWIMILVELELIYGFEIPDELYDKTKLTLEQFAEELSQLPVIPEELYPEFFDIKFTSMKLTKRYIELENKTDAESVREMQRINEKLEELDDRLNVLFGKK
jgi:hypothetical protein